MSTQSMVAVQSGRSGLEMNVVHDNIGSGEFWGSVDMPTLYALKPAFQNILRPLTQALAANGVTANQVTIAAAVLSVAAAALIAAFPARPMLLLVLPLVLFVRMALNA